MWFSIWILLLGGFLPLRFRKKTSHKLVLLGFFQSLKLTVRTGLQSLELTAKAPENRPGPNRQRSCPTIHFQVLSDIFREGPSGEFCNFPGLWRSHHFVPGSWIFTFTHVFLCHARPTKSSPPKDVLRESWWYYPWLSANGKEMAGFLKEVWIFEG